MGGKDLWNDPRKSKDEVDELRSTELLRGCENEVFQGLEAGIGSSENGMSVSRNDLPELEVSPEVSFELSVRRVGDIVSAEVVLLHLEKESEDLLVGETMEGSSEASKSSGVRLERVRESRSYEMASVSRDVPTFVVRVKGDVELEVLLKRSSRLGFDRDESGKLGGEVADEISLACWNDGKLRVLVVDVSENSSGEVGEFGDEVERVFEGGSPVFSLEETLLR